MAHWKRIPRPFKSMDCDSLTEKDAVPTNGSITKSGLTETCTLQKNVITNPPAQSPSQIEAEPENFANSQTEKDKPSMNCVAQQLTNIRDPHQHDVLMGRGNFVNYHPGNLYYRTLVKKHFLQYVSSCKNEKHKYAQLIIDEVGMRSPPGRFLRQDPETKLWFSVGHKKALDKTRQALREGAPEVKSRAKTGSFQEGVENGSTCGSVEKGGPPSEFFKTNSQRSIITPNHVGSSDDITIENNNVTPQTLTRNNNVVSQLPLCHNNNVAPHMPLVQNNNVVSQMPIARNNNAVAQTPLAQPQLYMNRATGKPSNHQPMAMDATHLQPSPMYGTVPMNTNVGNSAPTKRIIATERLANSVAARLMNSNGVTNENIENLVALGILAALNGGFNGDDIPNNTATPMSTNVQHNVSDEAPFDCNSIISNTNTNTNTAKPAATDESLVSAVASGVAKISELSSLVAKTSRRASFSRQMSDISMMSNKRLKRTSFAQPSLVKDSIGAEALLAMSHAGDDERRKDCNSDGESIPESIPVPLPKQIQHSKGNGIWSTPALGSFMQCDTCLGAGILPIPTDTPKELLPNPAMIIKPTNNSNALPSDTPRDVLPNPAMMMKPANNSNTLLPNINHKSFSTGNLINPVATSNEKGADEQKDEENGSISKESTKPASIWADRIRKVEEKWDIELDESKSFAGRVDAIESKALFCRSVLRDAGSPSIEENAASDVTPDLKTDNLKTDETLKEVELAEEKWGLSPPEGYNLTERIQLIEQTAYSFIQRLELWV